ncbi:hypothetical protein LINPERHAP1_LOCUS19841 [Linum perenne]
MLKLHQLYGLSTALFTIKEEPEIDIDAANSEVVVIQVDDGEEDGVTPFTTARKKRRRVATAGDGLVTSADGILVISFIVF